MIPAILFVLGLLVVIFAGTVGFEAYCGVCRKLTYHDSKTGKCMEH